VTPDADEVGGDRPLDGLLAPVVEAQRDVGVLEPAEDRGLEPRGVPDFERRTQRAHVALPGQREQERVEAREVGGQEPRKLEQHRAERRPEVAGPFEHAPQGIPRVLQLLHVREEAARFHREEESR
jgi:hypothetical protein